MVGKFTPIKYEKINYDDIMFFTKDGDVTYTTEISGGGVSGGGSSLTGAIIGGAIAGSAGAVIGSRKDVVGNPIQSRSITHDTTQTVLRYKVGNQYRERKFRGYDAYDYFISVIGEKDLLQMQLNNMNKQNQ